MGTAGSTCSGTLPASRCSSRVAARGGRGVPRRCTRRHEAAAGPGGAALPPACGRGTKRGSPRRPGAAGRGQEQQVRGGCGGEGGTDRPEAVLQNASCNHRKKKKTTNEQTKNPCPASWVSKSTRGNDGVARLSSCMERIFGRRQQLPRFGCKCLPASSARDTCGVQRLRRARATA